MNIEAQVDINGSNEAVWSAITDIANAASILGGVENIEVVERPVDGLVGLKWRETRMYFGKPATVEKRIIAAVENVSYRTQAEDAGFVFLSSMRITDNCNGVTLTSSHETQPQGFVARLKSTPMFFFKGVIKKALMQDLNDFKSAVEKN